MIKRLSALLIAGLAGLAGRTAYDRLGRFEITEASMSPALLPGDFIVTDRSNRQPVRGDIVVFEHPHRPSLFLVKRIVGLPGEQLTMAGGRVLINETPLDEPWTVDETGPDGTWDLRMDEAFVLGDARWMSTGDSRDIGPVPLEHLEMRVIFRYWPFRRIGFVSSRAAP
jgi:signal peptidase I